MAESLVNKIKELKKKHNAIILAHNYQLGEVQDVADFVGDSLGLSIEASKVKEEVIVFCGVNFMAETAAILSPQKTVIIPNKRAGCPMADMITAEQLREKKKQYPEAKVVCYVNTSAAVKAESDICCTSSNSIKVVNSIKDSQQILFVPDKYLGGFTAKKCPNKQFVLWNGYCTVHVKIRPEDIVRSKKEYPNAIVLCHPECITEVVDLSDEALSTGQMIGYVKKSDKKEFIIATEEGIIHTLQKQNPEKKFYLASQLAVCPNMKKINLEKIMWALEEMQHQVIVPKDIANQARRAIQNMINLVD